MHHKIDGVSYLKLSVWNRIYWICSDRSRCCMLFFVVAIDILYSTLASPPITQIISTQIASDFLVEWIVQDTTTHKFAYTHTSIAISNNCAHKHWCTITVSIFLFARLETIYIFCCAVVLTFNYASMEWGFSSFALPLHHSINLKH